MNDNAKTILDAGLLSAGVISSHGGIPFVTMPDGAKHIGIESLLTAPIRKRGSVITTDTSSFIHYTMKHGSLDDCTIYAEIESELNRFSLVAVINDHGDEKAQWRDHRCSYDPKQSVEWKRWLSNNKSVMSQADFATWLEDNLTDIAAVEGMPTGADVLAMALGFEANAEKKFRSKINLQSGGFSLEFVEDETKQTKTSMKVFERFTLGLPVFDSSASNYPLEARLKYREKSGVLNFWYELIRPDRVFKTAVNDEVERIQEVTGLPLLSGKPE